MKTLKLILLSLICSGVCSFAFSYPIRFVNNSRIDDKNIYIQIIVQGVGFWDFKKGCWDKSDGVQASSVTLADIKDQEVGIDDSQGDHGGKVYVSFGGPTDTKMVGDQYYSPIPATSFKQKNIVFDSIEIGLASYAIINQTSVDFVALPLGFQVDGKPQRGFNCTRSGLMDAMKTALEGTDFKSLLFYQNDAITAVNNPTHLGQTTIIDDEIKKAIPPKSNLKVATSDGVMSYFTTDSEGHINYKNITIPFSAFTSQRVFCNSPEDSSQANPDNIFGAVSAYILRGVDLQASNPDDKRFSDYKSFSYLADPYAKIIHDNCIDNRGYAFGYDDTGAMDFSSSEPRNGQGFTIFINDCKDLQDILQLQ